MGPRGVLGLGGGVSGLAEGISPALLQYLQMKWPLLDVPAGATLKDSRSPSPAHLVRAAKSHRGDGFLGGKPHSGHPSC